MINFSIILADDEQQILFGMKNGIDWESLGFSVVGTAQNGKEALELIEEYHPDLLISDIKMPFMDGLELSKIIHDNYINTKIILFSGWDDFEYARTAISYGVSQYLMKPIDYDEMQKLLTNIHEELEKEYAEKLNRTRLENIYAESIPLLRQQFFTQLLTEPVTDEYYDSQSNCSIFCKGTFIPCTVLKISYKSFLCLLIAKAQLAPVNIFLFHHENFPS